MPTLIRAFGLLTALALLWTVSVALLLYGGSWTVYIAQNLYEQGRQWLASQQWLKQPLAESLPPGQASFPDHVWALEWALIVMAVMTALAFAMNALQPLRWQVARALGVPLKKMHYLDKDDALHQRLQAIHSKLRTGKPVRMVVLNTDQPMALAMAAPFRGVVVVTRGLIEGLPAASLDWVIAHELAHIRYRDMLSGTIWIASVRGLTMVHRLKLFLIHSLYRVLAHIRLGIIAWILNIILSVVLLALAGGRRVAIFWFLLIDRLASRLMEYRADREAARHLGAQPGILALSMLKGDSEPLFNGLFATHPKISDRIKRLRVSQKDPGVSAKPSST